MKLQTAQFSEATLTQCIFFPIIRLFNDAKLGSNLRVADFPKLHLNQKKDTSIGVFSFNHLIADACSLRAFLTIQMMVLASFPDA